MTVSASAQLHFPPAFGNDTLNIRQDKITRAYITPRRIVWTSGDQAVKNPDLLLKPNTGQTDIFGSGMCVLDSRDGKKASIILDFGRELHGGLSLLFSSVSPAKTPVVRLRFGESVSETCSELNSKSLVETGSNETMDLKNNTATNDHAVRDMELTVPYYGGIEIGNSGFRFVRIDLLTPDMTINFKEVTAIMRYRNIPYLGSFKCDNERLNTIWTTGAYTVHLNMQDYVWDGIKRDRLIWLGDLHPETSTIAHVFGGDESVYSTLDLACKQYPLPNNWFNGMSAYSMWYLIIHYDWYMHNGNLPFLQKHADYIKGLISQIDERVNEDGTEKLGGGKFLDWPSSPNTKGVEAGYRALLVWAMKDAAKLCRILKDEAYAKKCEDIISRLNKKIMPHNDLKQASALMAIAGIGIAWFLSKKKEPNTVMQSVWQGFAWASIFLFLVAAAVCIWGFADFESLFLLFHQVSFANDLWLMNPQTDLMIALMPESFFMWYGGELIKSLLPILGIMLCLIISWLKVGRKEMKGAKEEK